MAYTCASCRSANVTVGVGDDVSCLSCGVQAARHQAGEPHRWVDVDLAGDADDTAGEVTVEAAPADDEEGDE